MWIGEEDEADEWRWERDQDHASQVSLFLNHLAVARSSSISQLCKNSADRKHNQTRSVCIT